MADDTFESSSSNPHPLPPRTGTIALVVTDPGKAAALVEVFSDDREIHLLQAAIDSNETDPVSIVYQYREDQSREDEEFGNYVEELLSQPFLRKEIQGHGVQWLRSKVRVERYQRAEADAARVIAEFAFKMFTQDPGKTDFLLAGPANRVRIRVFVVDKNSIKSTPLPSAA